jgi:subtilase family serine protease
VATLNVPALAPGAAINVQSTLASAAETAAISGGYLVLDPANAIQESNENNNHVVVTVAGAGGGGGSSTIWLPIIDR